LRRDRAIAESVADFLSSGAVHSPAERQAVQARTWWMTADFGAVWTLMQRSLNIAA
jgi:hypothetical protein